MALLFIPFYPSSIFFAFTFTDLIDFFALASLVIGMSGIWLVRRSEQSMLSWPLVALLFTLSLWPLLPHVGMYLMAQEFQRVEGYWPQVIIDDPKNYEGRISPRFDAYHNAVVYLQAFGRKPIRFIFGIALYGDRPRSCLRLVGRLVISGIGNGFVVRIISRTRNLSFSHFHARREASILALEA